MAPTPRLARTLRSWLAGQTNPFLVSTFSRAKASLALEPDLIITEVRLGEYNGLHLAMRALEQNTATIVIGAPDPVLEAESHKLGSTFVRTTDLTRASLDVLIAALARRRSSRSDDEVPWPRDEATDAGSQMLQAYGERPPRRHAAYH